MLKILRAAWEHAYLSMALVVLGGILILILTSIVFQTAHVISDTEEITHARSPDTTAISQRMAIICPGATDVATRAECTLTATEQLINDELRLIEIKQIQEQGRRSFQNLVVTIIGMFVSFAALMVLLRTLEQTVKTARATRRAAAAAIAANRGFSEASQRELRAYVQFDGQNLVTLPDSTHQIQGHWKNQGQTPTRAMLVGYGYWCRSDLPGPEFDFPTEGSPKRVEAGGKQVFIADGPVLTHQQMLDALEGRVNLIVWYWAEYRDVFADTPVRATRACMKVRSIQPANGDTFAMSWERWGTFNGWDEPRFRLQIREPVEV